jgi:UDP-N-acetylglucosamine diphosphorylase/glucosamine-1-phosphate N-acetyltransferase
MRLALFEDQAASGFAPIAWMRPVCELLCGQSSLRERLLKHLSVAEWGAFVRPFLAETYREAQPQAAVNNLEWLTHEPTLLVNARWLPDVAGLHRLKHVRLEEAGVIDQSLVWMRLHPDEVPLLSLENFDDALLSLARTRQLATTTGRMATRPWDLVLHNGNQLRIDFQLRRSGTLRSSRLRGAHSLGANVAVVGDVANLEVDPTARLDPFVVLDTRHGPISIDAGAMIQPFTRIEGPCHIGAGVQLFRANVREGTTIGPDCRVGGEVEASILHGFVNKYHDGFLGHSYVCPWVNLGALTTNSDLKNDYSNVSVPLEGFSINTGSTKVGSFIGDHTKAALATLFNTGSSIGVMCMLLPGGELLPKHVPSFCRIWHGVLDDQIDLASGLETARAVLGRRKQVFTPAHERLLRHIFKLTQAERETSLHRNREKRRAVPVT